MINKKSFTLLLTAIIFFGWNASFGQKPTQPIPEKTRILFLLDGSGSMLAKWENTLRINVAKTFLSQFVDSLKVNRDLEIALRVYGHQFDRRYHRCNDTKLEVPFSKNNHDQIILKLRQIEPKGTTPIAYSLEQAANDFPIDKTYRNIIIIITDGIESCDGDPCAVSQALQKKGIFLKPFIIGIGMEKDYREAFGCMGEYFDARNINDFRKALSKAVHQSLGETTVSVELLDESKNPTETNVNVSFINSNTEKSVFEFVHYRDRNGKPDSVEIDPVLTYDIVVNTIPRAMVEDIDFEGGKHTVLPVMVPQGYVKVNFPGAISYKNGVACLIKDPKTGYTHTVFQTNETVKLLTGKYILEVLTLPIQKTEININPRETSTISLDKPGIINFISTSKGIASIYELNAEGKQRWVHNLDSNVTNQTVTIQPGRYKVVYRSEQARGSKFTTIQNITITPGSTTTVRL